MKYEKYYLQDVKDESSKKLFNVISCFAGGGGGAKPRYLLRLSQCVRGEEASEVW